jgi:hypothetical protein
MLRLLLVSLLAAATLGAHAAGETPAPAGTDGSNGGSSFKSTMKRMGHDIGDAGKKVGHEFAKAGKQVGQGTVKAVKEIKNKVSSDVKTNNFKPRAQGKAPEGDTGRGDDQKP